MFCLLMVGYLCCCWWGGGGVAVGRRGGGGGLLEGLGIKLRVVNYHLGSLSLLTFPSAPVGSIRF